MANLMMHITCLCVAVLDSFYTKNLEKVGKIMNIQEYSEKFGHFSSLLNVCFHENRSAIKYLSTEKTSKNSRNSAYKDGFGLENKVSVLLALSLMENR